MLQRHNVWSKESAERGEVGGAVNREAELQSPFGDLWLHRWLRAEARARSRWSDGGGFLSDNLNAARTSEFRRLLPVYKGKNLQAARSTWVQWRHDASASVLMGPPESLETAKHTVDPVILRC